MRSIASRGSETRAGALAGALLWALAMPQGVVAGSRAAGAVLVSRLSLAGRAEARVERRAPDGLGGEERMAAGVLALELPDRVRLAFGGSGECVTLRSDGGEWLQPALRQLVRFGPESASLGLRWWSMLLGHSGGPHEERALGAGRYLLALAPADGMPGDSAWVTLDGEGLPRRLEIAEPSGVRVVYRLGSWRFVKPRGRSAFQLSAPAGFEVVDMR